MTKPIACERGLREHGHEAEMLRIENPSDSRLNGSGQAAILRPFQIGSLLNSGDNWLMGTKKTGKGRRKVGRKKRRMRAKIRHRKG